jgi:GT2 family glycosyltransferase
VPQKNKGIVEPEIYQEDYCLKASNGLTFYLIKDVPVNHFDGSDNFDYSDTSTWKAESNSYYYELAHCYYFWG